VRPAAAWSLAARGVCGEPAASAALDSPEPLDVDMDQLTGSVALVADRRLEAETSELAHPDPRQDPRHGQERHIEHLGDLGPVNRTRRKAAIAATRRSPNPVWTPVRRRGPITQPELPLGTAAPHPLTQVAGVIEPALELVLERALGSFEGIGAAIWAERAHTELESLVVQRPHGGLTTAEPRVAELAAAGLSNKEIAGKLFIAVQTVEVHLSHAYAKLGIRSRAQLPGWCGTADRPRVEVFRFAHGPRRVTVVKR
jgi:DNA-binding CsgD family transcriptional regulator